MLVVAGDRASFRERASGLAFRFVRAGKDNFSSTVTEQKLYVHFSASVKAEDKQGWRPEIDFVL
jgi:hypothetical protein